MKIRIKLSNKWSRKNTPVWLIDKEIELKKEPILLKYGSLTLRLEKVRE